MPERLFPERPGRTLRVADPALLLGLEQAAGAVARLDEALDGHPLLPAFLYRVRLEAVRRQASVDGHGIDAWHLAAVLEGLPLQMRGLDGFERGAILDAARIALEHHRWLVDPDFDQEGLVQDAKAFLDKADADPPILGAARQMFGWLDAGGNRQPMRAALLRHWRRRGLLRSPVPLTAPAALAADAPIDPTEWAVAFCSGLAAEARDYREILRQLEQQWLRARQAVAGRRSDSRAPQTIDVLAATPLCSATSLAAMLGLSIKSALALLEDLRAQGLVVEVTHRGARRLFGLAGMTPLQEVATAPRRPVPGRGPGRPRAVACEPALPEPEDAVLPPLSPITRFRPPPIDYDALDAAMAHCDAIIRQTHRVIETVMREKRPPSQPCLSHKPEAEGGVR